MNKEVKLSEEYVTKLKGKMVFVEQEKWDFTTIYCPYIPLIIYPPLVNITWFDRLKFKIDWWFYDVCYKPRKSKYLMECLDDLYQQHGSKSLTYYKDKE